MKRSPISLARIGLILGVLLQAQPQDARAQFKEDEKGLTPAQEAPHVRLNGRMTWLYQNPSGDAVSHASGAKLDITATVNFHTLGWWPGTQLVIRAEANYGESVNNRGGTILPVNLGLAYPGEDGDDRYDFPSIYLVQRIGTAHALMIGKINMLDLSIRRGSGGAGLDYFWNVGLAAPPSGLVPPYVFGALFTGGNPSIRYTVSVFDANSAVNRFAFDDPFEEGTNVLATVDRPVTIAGRRGTQGIKVAWSTKEEQDLSDVLLPADPGAPPDTKSRWYVAYTFKNFVVENSESRDGGWGVFGSVGVSDNPNTFDLSVALGVGGTSLFESRPLDQWGAGYFDFSLSDAIGDGLGAQGIGVGNERGFEVFYDYLLRSGLHVGVGFQSIDPTVESAERLNLFGLRASYEF